MNTGDLIVIQDGNKFRESVLSFQDKWSMAKATGMAMATVTVTVTATEKQTGKKVEIKHYGHSWKELPEQFVGIVTEIISEEHPDFDMFKIREQNGGYRYFRRFVLENL